jgi:hypothetical protein
VFCDSSSQCRLSVIDVLTVSSLLSTSWNAIHQWYRCYWISYGQPLRALAYLK